MVGIALLAPGTAPASVSSSYRTVVFSDGFDSGTLAAWSGFAGNGRNSVSSAAAHSGADGLRLANAANQYSVEIKKLSAALVNSSTSFWVRVNSAASGFSGTHLEDIAEARDNASSADVWELIYDSKRQGLWFFPFQQGNDAAIFTGTGTVPLGSWTNVEVRYNAASAGGAELLINGQTRPAWSVSGDYTRSDNLQRIQLWNDAATSTDFDSVVVATPGSSGSPPPPPPSKTALPQVSGTAQQGQTLSTSSGSWSNSPSSYTYRWDDCDSSGAHCSVIDGATLRSYQLSSADVGDTIRSVVTGEQLGGVGVRVIGADGGRDGNAAAATTTVRIPVGAVLAGVGWREPIVARLVRRDAGRRFQLGVVRERRQSRLELHRPRRA